MTTAPPARAHVITGGFPPGRVEGHDHDFARLRLLEMLREEQVPASAANDFVDIDRWLPISRLLITYVAGPYPDAGQSQSIRQWLEDGGHWLGLHGTSGGRAVRVADDRRRRMVKLDHHAVLGGFFLNHPPIRRFRVDVGDASDTLTNSLPQSFEVTDEPYMIEVQEPSESRVLLTAEIGPDTSPPGFGFVYEEDTALMPDGKTRVMAYTRPIGRGGVTYIALGHCQNPAVGTPPPLATDTWETAPYQTMLRNAMTWGMGG